MNLFSGTAKCEKHGCFEYKGYKLNPGEVMSCSWDVLILNFGGITKDGKYEIALCPVCKSRVLIAINQNKNNI